MNIKETQIGQKIIAIILVITLTLADFILIGINGITYAIDSSKTNAGNVEFMAYFENEKGERVTLNEKYINETDIKLKIDITVKGEGYFDGQLNFNDTNFKITTLEKNKYIEKLEGNKIILNRINAGTTATIAMKIAFNVSDEMDIDVLNKVTKINLTGNYVYSKKSIDINGETAIEVKWKTPQNSEALLNAEMLTFSDYKLPVNQTELEQITSEQTTPEQIVSEENKLEQRQVAQIKIDSKIKEDIYPIKNTKIEMTVPQTIEKVTVHKRTTDATNGDREFNANNYTYNKENNTLTINIANEENNGKIKHIKNSRDTLIVTYKYKKEAQDNNLVSSIKSTITTYDNKELTAETEIKTNEQKDGIITNKIQTKEEQIYKGKIYSGETRAYNTTTKMNVDLSEAVSSINQKEEETTFVKGKELFEANTEYRQTKINKQEFIELFGEEGTLTIKDQDEAVIAKITKETETDENNNIVIKYNEGVKSITTTTSKPKTEGILHLNHTKVILNSGYKREDIHTYSAIREKVETTITKIDGSKSNIGAYKLIKLEETASSAKLTLEKNALSVTEENQNLQLKLTLNTENETKDLYKNPKIKITFPEQITKISAKCQLLYGNGLEIKNAKVGKENGKQTMIIELKGEQKKYPKDAVNGATILVYTDVELNKMATTNNAQITVNYQNENATKYADNGKQVTNVKITNENGMILTNQIKDLNISTIGDEEAKEIKLPIKSEGKKTTVDMEIINNEEKGATNLNILGKIPEVEGKIERTSAVKLSTPAKVYYTNVENPTADINNRANNWTTENIEDAKNYLAVVDNVEKDQNIGIKYDVDISKNLDYNIETVASYKVSYNDNVTSNNIEVASSPITFATQNKQVVLASSTASGIQIETSANLVDKGLIATDEVYGGETIKYTVKITNNTDKDYANVEVKANQTNGYVWDDIARETINPYDNSTGISYAYQVSTKNEKTLGKIAKLERGKSYTFEYESSTYLLNDTKITGTETYGTISVTSQDKTLNENITTVKNKIKNSELKLTIYCGDFLDFKVTAGAAVKTLLTVENTTNETLNNIKVPVTFSKDLEPSIFLTEDNKDKVIKNKEIKTNEDGTKIIELTIKSLAPKEKLEIRGFPGTEDTLSTDKIEAWVTAKATTEKENTYSSNKMIRTVYDNTRVIQITQKLLDEHNKEIDKSAGTLENGNIVKLIATITNKDKEDIRTKIDYIIDEMLTIQSATLISTKDNNEENILEKISNNDFTKEDYNLVAGEKITITIVGKLNTEGINSITNTLTAHDCNMIKTFSDTMNISVKMKSEYQDVPEGNPDPVDTETPENPNNPDNPDNPNNPDNPDTPDTPIIPNTPDNPDTPNIPSTPDNPDNPDMPDTPSTPDNPDVPSMPNTDDVNTYKVSGIAWQDEDGNGAKDSNENLLSGIKVYAVNTATNNVTEVTTGEEGNYEIIDLPEGEYLIAFEYNTQKYMPTKYQAEGVSEADNSNVIKSNLKINGEEKTLAVSDTINVKEDISNINMGLMEAKEFDLELEKVISKITVINAEGTKTYDEKDTNLAKIEIAGKHLSGTNIIVEYKIKVKNTGEVAGYVKNIVDYIPSSLNFSATSNKGWYESEGNIYNSSLAKTKLEPGEIKELKLVLTKKMTESNTGLINNRAEIASARNSLGIADKDSKPNNQDKSEDDIGSADLIIGVKTGAAVSYVILTITTILVIFGMAFIISRKILKDKIEI